MEISASLLFSCIIQTSEDMASGDMRTLAPCSSLLCKQQLYVDLQVASSTSIQSRKKRSGILLGTPDATSDSVELSSPFHICLGRRGTHTPLFYPVGSQRVTSNTNMMISVISVDSFLLFSRLCI